MKKVLFFLTILFSNLIVKGNPSPNEEIFKYKVVSITPCTIEDEEIYPGQTTFPKDDRIIVVTDKTITVYITKKNTKVVFKIKDWHFEDGCLIYETRHDLTNDRVVVLIRKYDYKFTFSFLNFNEKECYIYKVEYFE